MRFVRYLVPLVLVLMAAVAQGDDSSSGLLNPEEVQLNANRIYDNTMSPYCPGRTLSACPSDKARVLREEIFGWLRDGATEDEVRGRLKITYGDQVSGLPEGAANIGLGWALPVAFGGFGVLLVVLLVKRASREAAHKISMRAIDGALATGDPIRDKIEQELQKRLKS